MIRIQENNKPNIENVKFECDEEISPKLNEFELAKIMWTIIALEQGATFKGIVGLRII